jgi:hypothetical protein
LLGTLALFGHCGGPVVRFDVEMVLFYASLGQLALLAKLPHASTLNRDSLVACQVGDLLYAGDAVMVVVRREWHLASGRTALLIFAEVKKDRRARVA